MEDKMSDREDRELIAHLDQCNEACSEGIIQSLGTGGDHAKTDHIRWLLNCADICQISKNFVVTGSKYAGDILSTCAFLCEDCAQSCEDFADDEHMKNCALVCRDCAKVCRESIDEEMEEDEDLEEDIEEEPEEKE